MEQTEVTQDSTGFANNSQTIAALPSTNDVRVSQGGSDCPTCGGVAGSSPPSYVYVPGTVGAQFPNKGLEKEFAQATGRADTTNMTDRQSFHAVLSHRDNRYLARQLCWVLSVQGLETYILQPRDPANIDLLIEAIDPDLGHSRINVVIGQRGPIAPPSLCNGLMLPLVAFDQIYSFDRETFIKSIPKPDAMSAEEFRPATEEVLDRILQMIDNTGNTGELIAENYIAMRYDKPYQIAAQLYARNFSLTGVEARPSSLSGMRNIVDVIYSYTNRQTTDVTEKFIVRVDVTDKFPFLVTKMSPYYDR